LKEKRKKFIHFFDKKKDERSIRERTTMEGELGGLCLLKEKNKIIKRVTLTKSHVFFYLIGLLLLHPFSYLTSIITVSKVNLLQISVPLYYLHLYMIHAIESVKVFFC
jgi:hypothetical protein